MHYNSTRFGSFLAVIPLEAYPYDIFMEIPFQPFTTNEVEGAMKYGDHPKLQTA